MVRSRSQGRGRQQLHKGEMDASALHHPCRPAYSPNSGLELTAGIPKAVRGEMDRSKRSQPHNGDPRGRERDATLDIISRLASLKKFPHNCRQM